MMTMMTMMTIFKANPSAVSYTATALGAIYGVAGAYRTICDLSPHGSKKILEHPWPLTLISLSSIGGAVTGQWLIQQEKVPNILLATSLCAFLFLGLGGPAVSGWGRKI